MAAAQVHLRGSTNGPSQDLVFSRRNFRTSWESATRKAFPPPAGAERGDRKPGASCFPGPSPRLYTSQVTQRGPRFPGRGELGVQAPLAGSEEEAGSGRKWDPEETSAPKALVAGQPGAAPACRRRQRSRGPRWQGSGGHRANPELPSSPCPSAASKITLLSAQVCSPMSEAGREARVTRNWGPPLYQGASQHRGAPTVLRAPKSANPSQFGSRNLSFPTWAPKVGNFSRTPVPCTFPRGPEPCS